MKKCFKCFLTKTLDEFYKHSQMHDGYLNKCKPCTKKDTAENRNKHIEYYLEYDRNRPNKNARAKKSLAYNALAASKERRKESYQAWRKQNAWKVKANNAVNNSIRDGKITQKPCVVCGNKDTQGHHIKYDKINWLNVRWLCVKHHAELHSGARELLRKEKTTLGKNYTWDF